MTELLVTAVGLGLAGIDPAGAAIAVVALAKGLRGRAVIAYAAIVVVATSALGTALSLIAGPSLGDIDWLAILDVEPSALLGAVEIALAAGLLYWAAARTRRPDARPKRPQPERGRSETAMLGIGVLFAASMATDPTFIGLVIIGGRDEPAGAVVVAQLVWILVSQLPLVVLAVAVAFGAHQRVVDGARRAWARVAPAARIALTGLLVVAGLVIAADGIAQIATGEYLIGPDT